MLEQLMKTYYPVTDAVTCDVSALLWVISWPLGKLQFDLNAYKALVCHARKESDITLVFDRYLPGGIKTFTRMERAGSTRVYNLISEMPAPAKQVVLSNTKNKILLN